MADERVYLNGGLVAAADARVSAFDAGVLQGVGLFATMRCYWGKVFRLEAHLDRLVRSAGELGLHLSQDRAAVVAAAEEVVAANEMEHGHLRLTVTGGNTREFEVDRPAENAVLLAAQAAPYEPQHYSEHGVMVTISGCKQHSDDPLAGHRATSCFGRLAVLQKAQMQRASEALWFTETNRLAEACFSSVFLVREETLLTPPLGTPICDGVERAVVLEAARTAGIPAEEKELVIKDVLAAEEIFLTNSLTELLPVARVEKHVVGEETPGAVYRRLHEGYRETVRKECADAAE